MGQDLVQVFGQHQYVPETLTLADVTWGQSLLELRWISGSGTVLV